MRRKEESPNLEEFQTLPDYLRAGLDLVFVGLNPSVYSVEVGHYFANPRNRFWGALNLSGLVNRQVGPEDDASLTELGIGFTDVVKRPTRMGSGLKAADFRHWAPVLKEKLLRYQPGIVCFQGTTGYRPYLKYTEGINDKAEPGLQPITIGQTRVFVVPNPSPANAKFSLDDLAGWFSRLSSLRAELSRG